MEKVYKKIEAYLREVFPGVKIIKVDHLDLEEKGVELYGFNSFKILIKSTGTELFYFPVFNGIR